MTDFLIINHGSIVTVLPLTEAAKDWMTDNVELPDWAGWNVPVEPRYAGDLIDGIIESGFTIN